MRIVHTFILFYFTLMKWWYGSSSICYLSISLFFLFQILISGSLVHNISQESLEVVPDDSHFEGNVLNVNESSLNSCVLIVNLYIHSKLEVTSFKENMKENLLRYLFWQLIKCSS